MADYRIQLKDKEGNRQFPVTTTQSIVDSEGRSLEEILANLGDGGGSGGGSAPASSGPLRVWINEILGVENTPEQIAENVATYSSLLNNGNQVISVAAAITEEGTTMTSTYPIAGIVTLSGAINDIIVVVITEYENGVANIINLTLNADGSVTFEQ